jgi:hypothetical protein
MNSQWNFFFILFFIIFLSKVKCALKNNLNDDGVEITDETEEYLNDFETEQEVNINEQDKKRSKRNTENILQKYIENLKNVAF